MNKLTDSEIVKALECCSKKDCKQCSAFDEDIECGENTITLALDLINRKDEMINGLIAGQETLQKSLAEKNAEIEELKADKIIAKRKEEDARKLYKETVVLLEQKNEEIQKLEYTIMGIMHSVDKWLDGKELEQDEVNRAATMREKTLQIAEKKQAEIERLLQKLQNPVVAENAITVLREKCIEHQDFHKGDDGVFRGYISIEDLDVIIDELQNIQ